MQYQVFDVIVLGIHSDQQNGSLEIGENAELYFFGFKESGIAVAYVLGYVLAAFTTFVTLLCRCGTLQKLF